ncbi:BTAD domain-containing putative transcriptional regulator [Streptomyces sp. NPDC050145]|uniref:BTAD domain-containing putative transcriptional regulator n=1 Tax=Streptomyces sp. NPDC050145 TaxID=3365602 RepID=UPI0037BBDC41
MQYRILGATQAIDDANGDTPVPLAGPRLRALLTSLALHTPHPAPVHTLIDDVWPDTDTPPADAPAALQALVARLRRALGKDAVTSETGGYRLAAARDDIDAHVFARLTRDGTRALAENAPDTAARTLRDALALWHGPALTDLPLPDGAVRPEARRLEAQRLEATRARAEADLLLGRAADLVPELRELTTAHPYDEPLHALLIRALRATGRGADALAAYEQARRTLADGLGTDPGPDLRRIHAELLSAAPAPAERAERADTAEPVEPPAPRTPVRSGNLRPRLNSFVGREPELDAIRSDLRGARLVTLTGPGGSGKTRLAEEAATPFSPAWLVELAPLDDPRAVPGAVVSALGLRETVLMTSEMSTVPQDDPTRLLIEHCAQRGLLLILDNCEHVIDAAAQLAETLLTHCPSLTILATSREPLGVPGESVRPVEPLPPDPASRLFAERAAAVRPGFDPAQDRAAVAEICRRLDGLPLAIELAAARLRLLTPRQIADRLDDRFRLLTGGSRTVLPRQQTLRAVVDWSWDLLDEQERRVLCELSVFAGGWDLEAAESVCAAPPATTADALGSLLDKSLLIATPQPGTTAGMRYRMLETIHEYATERAAEFPGLRRDAGHRHTAWVRALLEEADPKIRSAEQLPWIQRLETELDNIRAALARATQPASSSGATFPDGPDEETAIALTLLMGWFWWLRNYRTEAVAWLERVTALLPGRRTLDDPEHPLYWPRMNLRLLDLFLLADTKPQETVRDDADREYIARVQAAFAPPNPRGARFPGIIWPFSLFFLDEERRDVRASLDAALANCRRYGGDWEIGVTLMFRTHVAVDMPGNMRGVDGDLAELRDISRRVGDRWMRAQVCSAAGEAAMARGLLEEARAEYEESLRLAYEVGAYAEAPFLLARLAELSYRSGDKESAWRTLDVAHAEASQVGVTDTTAFVRLLRGQLLLADGEVAAAREQCDEARALAEAGTPPPQFIAVLGALDARVTAAESGPEAALALLVPVLRDAVMEHCAEAVTGGLIDVGAELKARAGGLESAVRLFAASAALRGELARPYPERKAYEDVESRARDELGAARHETLRAQGRSLTPDQILAELEPERP